MMKLLLVCALVASCYGFPTSNSTDDSRALNCECGVRNQNRIIGGSVTGVNEYSFMTLLMTADGSLVFCGGSIITPIHILTAAHCTDDFVKANRPLAVLVGEHDYTTNQDTSATQYHRVARVIQHSSYNPNNFHNDIAILVLSSRISFNRQVGPVCMPPSGLNLDNMSLTAIGWGKTSNTGSGSTVLKHVSLTALSQSSCRSFWGNFYIQSDNTQVCTLNPGSGVCNGDSGGPFVVVDPNTNRWTQVALTSFGLKGRCADTTPSVQTRVSAYLGWIRNTISGSGFNTCSNY